MVRNFTRSINGWVASCCFFKHPAVELQPAEFAINEILGRRKFSYRRPIGDSGSWMMLGDASGDDGSTFGCMARSTCATTPQSPIGSAKPLQHTLAFGFAAVAAGQHSTISSARNRNSVRRANFRSSRRFFRDLGNRTNAIKLGGKLCFRDS